MVMRSAKAAAAAMAAAACVLALAPPAQAEDFLSALFGAFTGGRLRAPAMVRMPFAGESDQVSPPGERPGPRIITYGGGQAFCVRTCDGRYFPLSAPDRESRAASCNNFCPASQTEVVYGSTIDDAATESGEPYSELPNAFRFRNEIVAGCTCNGRDQIGLAPVSIDKDPTLRKGDLVADPNGLVVANGGADKRGAELKFSPASRQLRARYQSVPVVAQE